MVNKQQLWEALKEPIERGAFNCKNNREVERPGVCWIIEKYPGTCNCYANPRSPEQGMYIDKEIYTKRWEWDGKTK